MKRCCSLLFTLAVMALIFYFSAQPGKISRTQSDLAKNVIQSQQSERVVPVLAHTVNSSNVRKWAHFALYAVLGASVWQTAMLYFNTRRRKLLAGGAFAFCLLYAVSDEIHQIFVPARTALASDVVLDGAGSLCGMLLLFCFGTFVQKIRTKREPLA